MAIDEGEVSKKKDGVEELARGLGTAISKLIESGFELPFHVTAVAVNGSIQAYRYERDAKGGLQATMLAGHDEGGLFALPINMMFVDRCGKVAHVLIESPGAEPKIFPSGSNLIH